MLLPPQPWLPFFSSLPLYESVTCSLGNWGALCGLQRAQFLVFGGYTTVNTGGGRRSHAANDMWILKNYDSEERVWKVCVVSNLRLFCTGCFEEWHVTDSHYFLKAVEASTSSPPPRAFHAAWYGSPPLPIRLKARHQAHLFVSPGSRATSRL